MKRLLCAVMAALLAISAAAYAESSGQQVQALAGETVEKRLSRMVPVLDSLARNMLSDGGAVYDAASPDFFWNQLYLCGANWGDPADPGKPAGSNLTLSPSEMQEYAAASFYGSEGFPQIQQDVTTVRFDAAANAYQLEAPDAFPSYIVVERQAAAADGTLLVGIGLYSLASTARIGGLLVRLADCSDPDAVFPYSVKSAAAESKEDFLGLAVTSYGVRETPGPLVPTAAPAPTATPAPAIPEYPRLATGSRGEAVKALQTRLKELGYPCGSIDGVYGANTKQGVRYFQDAIGQDQDGVATNALQKRLFEDGAPKFVTYVQLRSGSDGVRVEKLQTRLRELGYLAKPVDGKFGARTKEAVMLFQKKASLKIDGIAGTNTLRALYSKNAPKCTDYITLTKGDTGPRVKEMQTRLSKLGFFSKKAAGTYNTDTVKALQAFMKAVSQDQDGKTADAELLKKLFEYTPPAPTPTPAPAQAITDEQLNAFTSALNSILPASYAPADAVKWLQHKLNVSENGIYDKTTKDTVSAYQTDHGLGATGVADADTIHKLLE